jgi:hypothetical protein
LQSQVRELHRLLGKKTLEAEKTVAKVIGVSRSNLAERRQGHPQKRIGWPPLPDEELVAQIRAVIAELHVKISWTY